MIEPAEYDDNTKTVTLDGKKWPIPALGIRQLRLIRRPLLEMNERLKGMKIGDLNTVFSSLDEADYDQLIVNPIYQALTRAHPTMKKEEFLDLAASEAELIAAYFEVRDASGVFVKAGEGEDSGEGEAKAA